MLIPDFKKKNAGRKIEKRSRFLCCRLRAIVACFRVQFEAALFSGFPQRLGFLGVERQEFSQHFHQQRGREG